MLFHDARDQLSDLEKDALLYAKTGKAGKLAECLANGASPNQKDLLYYAAKRGHAEAVELLLAHGADPNAKNQMDDGDGRPLHYAAYGGYLRIVEKLLAHGADPNAKNLEHGTPLAYAVSENHLEVVQILKNVTSTRITYSIDEALMLTNPVDGYYRLQQAMAKDWHRGHSPAELRFLSLHAFSAYGWRNGTGDMLSQSGLWSINSGIELFDAIDEPICAEFLRDGLAVIREQCVLKGLEMTADLDLRFDRPAELKLQSLNSKLWDSGAAGYDDDRVFGKTMAYVAQNRHLYE